jgi:REP element-mobilizing transposase RayT
MRTAASSLRDGQPPVASPSLPGDEREITVRTRGRLPHWEIDGGLYFVTYRLADSLPRSVHERKAAEREQDAIAARQWDPDPAGTNGRRLEDLTVCRNDAFLDAGWGACHLARPDVARGVAGALRHFDEQRYRLFAWCVMPNHVHVVLRLFLGTTLARTLHSWKSLTAKEANRLLGRDGEFWQREYYDHLVRDEAELAAYVRYVAENPMKAGLREWPWVWALDLGTMERDASFLWERPAFRGGGGRQRGEL